MKRLLTLILTLVLANVAIQSKAGSGENEKKAKAQVERMTQQLSLTKEQQDKLYPIALNFITQKESIKASGKNEAENKRRIDELKKESETKMQTILTHEQIAKWRQMKAQNGQKREESKKTR
jgi:Spy/CpxP family protein refolding chaperone